MNDSRFTISPICLNELNAMVTLSTEAFKGSPWFSNTGLFCPTILSEQESISHSLRTNLAGCWKVSIDEITVGILTSVKIGNLIRVGSGDREPAIVPQYQTFGIGCQLLTRLYETSLTQKTEGLFTTLKSPLNFDIHTDYHFNLYKNCGLQHTSRSIHLLKQLKSDELTQTSLVNITETTREDLSVIVDIVLESYKTNLSFQYDPLTNDPKSVKTFQETWLAPENSSVGFLAYKNKKPIAYASYTVVIKDNIEFGLVGIIGVLPKFQNQNIGKKLINHIHGQLIKQQIAYSVVATSIYNTAAQALYRSLGYSPIYYLDYFYRLKTNSSLSILQDNELMYDKS